MDSAHLRPPLAFVAQSSISTQITSFAYIWTFREKKYTQTDHALIEPIKTRLEIY